MTTEDEFTIKNFELKLSRLMEAYTQLAEENRKLHEQLNQQSAKLNKVFEEYTLLEKSYSNLKLAKIISIDDTEIGNTKKRLSKLVRDVETCIALLNASKQTEDML